MSIKSHRPLRALIVPTLISLLLSGCGLASLFSKKSNVSTPVVSSGSKPTFDDVAAFQATVYQVTSQKCVACHGSIQQPLHASPNVNTAYQAALPLVDFSNPPASLLAIYSGNGHCSSSVCVGDDSQMLSAILTWLNLRPEYRPARPANLQSEHARRHKRNSHHERYRSVHRYPDHVCDLPRSPGRSFIKYGHRHDLRNRNGDLPRSALPITASNASGSWCRRFRFRSTMWRRPD